MAVRPEILDVMRSAATSEPSVFIASTLFSCPPFAFRGRPSEYDEFRREVATRLAIGVEDVELVGSGRLGFSLNPDHLLRPFGRQSDLDLVIVSSAIFDAAWEELLANAGSISLANEDEKRRLRRTRENFFYGYLRPDHVPLSTFLAREWFPKLSIRFSSAVVRLHDVHAWLFKSRRHAETFYAAQLAQVQSGIKHMLELRGDL